MGSSLLILLLLIAAAFGIGRWVSSPRSRLPAAFAIAGPELAAKPHEGHVASLDPTSSPVDVASGAVPGFRDDSPAAALQRRLEILLAAVPLDGAAIARVGGELAVIDLKTAQESVWLAHRCGALGTVLDAMQASGRPADRALRLELTESVLLRWEDAEPGRGITWLQQLRDSAAKERLLAGVSHALAASEPRRASELALEIQHAAGRRTALAAAVQAWFESSPAEATAWVDRFEPHPDLDYIAAAIATMPAMVATRADVAVGWAESITDERLRISSLSTIVSAWARRNRAAAMHYVETSPALNGEERYELKRMLTGRPSRADL